jgi:hypothetical protein
MSPLARSVFDDLAAWQQMLERHEELFCDMVPGSCIGIIPKSAASLLPGRRGVAPEAAGPADLTMLAWQNGRSGMLASYRSWRGPGAAGVDLLLVADDEALEAMHGHPAAFELMKKLIRRGNILFYVMRTKQQLQDAGYEDFLESLGLAFLGACR